MQLRMEVTMKRLLPNLKSFVALLLTTSALSGASEARGLVSETRRRAVLDPA